MPGPKGLSLRSPNRLRSGGTTTTENDRIGVRSETFYAGYQSGEEPEDDEWMLDFGEWASVYRTYLVRQAEYRNEVQRSKVFRREMAGIKVYGVSVVVEWEQMFGV